MELAKTTAEQRAGMYEDVRALISPGYLAHHVSIGDARFVIRSIDNSDWKVLEYRTHKQGEKAWRAWCLATAIWMVNGTIVGDHEETTYRLYETLSDLPRAALDTFYGALNGLMRRVIDASQVVEAFLYEPESRALWRTSGSVLVNRRIGASPQRFYNPVFSLWVYYNQMEDARLQEETDWTLAKFMVGPHAPKSLKKINAQDNKRLGDLNRRRERTQDRIYYEVQGLLVRKTEEDKIAARRKLQQVVMAETEEELRESMRRWVAGIKDDHDSVVDNVKARIKHGVEQRKRDAANRRRALDAALSEEGFARNQLTPLHGEAGKKFMERMSARVPGAKQVFTDNTHNSAYRKYIENNPEVGDMYVDEDGNIISTRPVTEEMLEVLTKDDQGGKPTLQEQIENRRPTATFVDEGEE